MGVIFIVILAVIISVPGVRHLEGKTVDQPENQPETLNS
jgi:hypothetical protein